MMMKYIILLFIACLLADGKKSIVIVTDTSRSMDEEINILKNHIESVVKTLPSSGDFKNYILVPFTDPDVGPPKISLTPEGLLNSLSTIEVRGGDDCLENSLAAVEKALEIGNDFSNIFLFTDAPPKDITKLPFVQTLCRKHLSQVVIFLSGDCPGTPGNYINVYNEIAKSCSGAAFYIDVLNLRHVFKYMKAIVNVEWSNINTHKEFMGHKIFNFTVDKYTKEIIVAVSGDYPEIQVTNNVGANTAVETIMEAKGALVIRLSKLPIGDYNVEICSKENSLPTFYKWKTLEFNYGFSPKKPRNLKETSQAPLPDYTSYLIIEQLDSNIEVLYGILLSETSNEKKILDLNVLDEGKGLYMAQEFFKTDKPFRVSIHGREKTTLETIKGTSKIIAPQLKVAPQAIEATVEAIKLEPTLAEFMDNVTLFCKVTGEPKPEIWWEDENGNRIDCEDVLFEWPSTYISYAFIRNATSNTTIYCKGKNTDEESSMLAEFFVHREFIFDVLQSPSDMTIEYGTEGKLFCKVIAYPEATIKWYHNDTTIENTENIEIVLEENMLLIKSMGLEDSGEYKCEVSNEVETRTFTAVVDISGIEAPSIEIEKSEYILKIGDNLEVECKVLNGAPTPKVTWKKQIDGEFDDIPDGVSVDENVLKISSAETKHVGVYKCDSVNIAGEDSKELRIKVQYRPIIKNGGEMKMVNVGESVQLECDVDAEPKATVHWDMYKGDVIVPLDGKLTDDRNTYHFLAQQHDSGTYFCVAENELGRSEKKVSVVILEAPFIEPLGFDTLRKRVGDFLMVTCNVSLGLPVPIIRWEFISTKSTVSVISRKTATKLDLIIRNISNADEGTYRCIAENEVSPDSVRFYLNVVP